MCQKVLIVDDEAPIKEWICMCIQNSGIDCEIYSAQNGQEAWEIYLEVRPEMVITDICMPVMDGLELLRRIKALDKTAAVIILSCYGEFLYAQEALRLGALEYVLKTEVTNTKLRQLLERYAPADQTPAGSTASGPESSIMLRDLWVRYLLRENPQETAIWNWPGSEILWQFSRYAVFAIELLEGNGAILQNKILNEAYRTLYLPYNNETYLQILEVPAMARVSQQLQYLQRYGEYLSKDLSCLVGCSGVYSSAELLPRALRQALCQIATCFYDKHLRISLEANAPSMPDRWDQEPKELYQAAMECKRSISQHNPEASEQAVNDFLKLVRNRHFPNIAVVKSTASMIICAMQQTYHLNSGFVTEQCGQIARASHYNQVCDVVQAVLLSLDRVPDIQSEHIRRAVAYIREHYAEITHIDQVAGYLGLNPVYFSKLFKETCGKNFSSYVTELRMGEAERLIRNTTWKISEVAEKVGYHNLAYFSTVFKKCYGQNPFEYRKKDRSGGQMPDA